MLPFTGPSATMLNLSSRYSDGSTHSKNTPLERTYGLGLNNPLENVNHKKIFVFLNVGGSISSSNYLSYSCVFRGDQTPSFEVTTDGGSIMKVEVSLEEDSDDRNITKIKAIYTCSIDFTFNESFSTATLIAR